MVDVLYVIGTVAFFGLMLGYVSFCERIGKSSDVDVAPPEARP
jgi:hypothetical protein